jgi:hypothetical protein
MRQILLMTAAALAISTAAISGSSTMARAEAEGWYAGGGSPNASYSYVPSRQCVDKVRYTSCFCVRNPGYVYSSSVR